MSRYTHRLLLDLYVVFSILREISLSFILSHQDKLRDRDARIEEMSKSLSEKQDSISRLEKDLANCRLELVEREKRINDILHNEVCGIFSIFDVWRFVFFINICCVIILPG